MISNELADWLSTTNLSLASEVDGDAFERFLIHLSTDQGATYETQIAWLLALRTEKYQGRIVETYLKNFSSRQVGETPENSIAWIWSNITLTIECNPEYLPCVPNEAVSSGERYVVHVLHNQNIINFDLANPDSFRWINRNSLFEALQALSGVARVNACVGAEKSATIYLSLCYRLAICLGMPPITHVELLRYWGMGLQKLGLFEDAASIYVDAISVFREAQCDQPEVCAIGGSLLTDFGGFLLEVGEDRRDVDEALKEAYRLLDKGGNVPDADLRYSKGRCELYVGIHLQQAGNFEAANEHLQIAKATFGQMLQEVRAPILPEYLRTTRLLAIISLHLYGYAAATETLLPAYFVFSDPDVQYRLDLLTERVQVELLLGTLGMRTMGPSDVLKHFRDANDVLQAAKPRLKDKLEGLECEVHLRWAGALAAGKDRLQALERYQIAVDCITKAYPSPAKTAALMKVDAMLGMAAIRIKENEFNMARMQIEDAMVCLNSAEISSSEQESIDELRIRGIFFLALAECREAKYCEGLIHIRECERLLRSTELAHRPDLEFLGVHLCLLGVSCLGYGIDKAWILEKSEFLWQVIQAREEFSGEGDAAYALFLIFHYRWLAYAACHAVGDLPTIMSRLHARVLAERVEEAFSEHDADSHRDDSSSVEGHRREVRRERDAFSRWFASTKFEIAQELEKDALNGLKSAHSLEERGRSGGHAYNGTGFALEFSAQMEAHRSAHRKAARELRLAHARGAHNAMVRSCVFRDSASLAQSLSENEVLVALIDARTLEIEGYESIEKAYVWTLDHNGQGICAVLTIDLDSVVTFVEGIGERVGVRRLRKGPACSSKPTTFNGWTDFMDYLDQCLVRPVLSMIPSGTSHLSLVSHGRFHMLPDEIFLKTGIGISHYVGLQFVGRRSTTNLDLLNFFVVPNADSGLPFANREAIPLLSDIWRSMDGDVVISVYGNNGYIDATQKMQCMHLAGHGRRRPDKHRFCHRTSLVISDGFEIDPIVVANALPSAERVWVSSCVLGVTEDDKEGDPTGLIVPFLLCGSRYVFACLTSVPDLWMPLLVSLTEWLICVRNYEPGLALKEAKARLHDVATDELVADFRVAYRRWLADCCVAWFQSLWACDSGEPWKTAPEEHVDFFVWDVVDNDFPEFGIELSQVTAEQLKFGQGPGGQNRVDQLIDVMTEAGLRPPVEICDTLRYALKLFESHSVLFADIGRDVALASGKQWTDNSAQH